MTDKDFERLKRNLKALKYTIGIFSIIMFLWWFQGGHIIPVLAPQISPAQILIVVTANAFKSGLATIFNAIISLFK